MNTGIAPMIITGVFSLAAAILSLATTLIVNKQKRRWEVEDKKMADETQQAKNIEALMNGVKWILYDRIKYLGFSYLKEGKVAFDDRRVLGEMHKIYHNGLKGNGDLDKVMAEVDKLPLKGE